MALQEGKGHLPIRKTAMFRCPTGSGIGK